jgi:hypothetical protein
MTDIFVENAALTSPTFRVRADHLAKVLSGSSYKALFAPQKKKLSTADLFFLGIFGAMVFGTVFLVGTMYA